MTRKTFVATMLLAMGFAASSAAEPALRRPLAAVAAPAWSGFYLGGHAGGLYGTSTFSDPYGPSVFGDHVTKPGFLAGLQFGYNWRLASRWVGGIEVDASYIDGEGTYTCLQDSATLIGSNCKVAPRALATLTGRLGALVDREQRTLVYGKAGLAWTRGHASINPNNAFGYSTAAFSGDALVQGEPTSKTFGVGGWVVGAGIERALDPAWSMKLEYGYYRFGSTDMATPETVDVTEAGVVTQVGPATSRVSQDMHIVKIGLNYHFNRHLDAAGEGAFAAQAAARPFAPAKDWEIELGTRYWYSSGRAQNENATVPVPNVSRLTYDNMTSHSGELFGRLDAPGNLFLKGFVGLGSTTKGRHNDEDWGLDTNTPVVPIAFEVTDSKVSGVLRYATVDIGLNVLRDADYKVGFFAGYNYFHATMNTFGCDQLVQPASGICSPSHPQDQMGVSQEDNWHSFRLGVSAETKLWHRFSMSGDFAYLPYVHFEGLDTHWLREPAALFPQNGSGRGVQVELVLNYRLTGALNIGLGGRYWAMWTTDAVQSCHNCGGAGTFTPPSAFKANTERYGMFVQLSYRK